MKCVRVFVCLGVRLSFQRGGEKKKKNQVSDRGEREVTRACP